MTTKQLHAKLEEIIKEGNGDKEIVYGRYGEEHAIDIVVHKQEYDGKKDCYVCGWEGSSVEYGGIKD